MGLQGHWKQNEMRRGQGKWEELLLLLWDPTEESLLYSEWCLDKYIFFFVLQFELYYVVTE